MIKLVEVPYPCKLRLSLHWQSRTASVSISSGTHCIGLASALCVVRGPVRVDRVPRLDTRVMVYLNHRRPIVFAQEEGVGGCLVFVTWFAEPVFGSVRMLTTCDVSREVL